MVVILSTCDPLISYGQKACSVAKHNIKTLMLLQNCFFHFSLVHHYTTKGSYMYHVTYHISYNSWIPNTKSMEFSCVLPAHWKIPWLSYNLIFLYVWKSKVCTWVEEIGDFFTFWLCTISQWESCRQRTRFYFNIFLSHMLGFP